MNRKYVTVFINYMLLKGEIKVKSVPNPHQPNLRINSLHTCFSQCVLATENKENACSLRTIKAKCSLESVVD